VAIIELYNHALFFNLIRKMAKARNTENLQGVDLNTPPKIENISLKLPKDTDRLNITTKRGKKHLWTVAQCLLPENWRQLSDKNKQVLIGGNTVHQVLENRELQ